MTITARQVAADVLNRSRSRDGFAAELIDDVLNKAALTPQDRRFVTQLVFGVIRRSGTLDAILKPFIQLPFHAVQPRVWDLLRLGAFQLTFLTHVPKHAAVNETVELAPYVGALKAKGFVNGVLRRVSELVTDDFTDKPGAGAVAFGWESLPTSSFFSRRGEQTRDAGISPPSFLGKGAGGLGSDSSPSPIPPLNGEGLKTADGSRPLFLREESGRGSYRRLARSVLPDPVADPTGYFAAAFSFPQWLANRWIERYGPAECTRLGFWFNAPPPLWIRVNKLNASRESYRVQLAGQTIEAAPGAHPQSLLFPEHHAIRDLPGFAAGDFAVQDHSSMLVASALGVKSGMRVLDACAAPGGKTTHLMELMDNRGHITACDIEAKRLQTVTTLCQRLGIQEVETVLLKEDGELPPGPFDAALVDVPCSNTGVLGRRPEVRWRLKPNEFEHLIRLQTRLLILAAERVKPGGAVVYSTCSIEPDENEGVVRAVCRGMRSLALEAEHTSVPGRPSDGGYWARLRKAK
ncbi:Ribosomal RNA small subunit methyltransferase B [Gemmata sp. SH-PL17]|uniref:transcription antitermination factor NusB n=1 Tax=Gemmata sp. SH-PL17 TaxID=1630693 RepID=UPI00078B68DF|nr:transcription antitermination factor NusB [Gemmata sp. SH-PL17]AMV22930.1 Ribosomal RNA small subunit methyltransferase B [Gemmata sp. SH-PL17]